MTTLLQRQLDAGRQSEAGRLSSHPLDVAAIVLIFAAFPIALIGDVGGIRTGGFGWVLALVAGVFAMMIVPIEGTGFQRSVSFSPFLGLRHSQLGLDPRLQ